LGNLGNQLFFPEAQRRAAPQVYMSARPDPFRTSLFDRLLPDAAAVRPLDGLLRDLENLLNTRLDGAGSAAFPEVRRSVAGYGMPDLGSLEALAPEQQATVCRAVTEAIERFEPRLRRARARWVAGTGDGAVIHIEAETTVGAERLTLAVERAGGRLRLRSTAGAPV
jgi:type VI secretion system lysozyme-like protein